jgi:flagellar protein FlaG
VKVSSISTEVGLATRATEKPTPKHSENAGTSGSQKIEWPETIGVNIEVSEKTLQKFKPLVNGLGLGLQFSKDPETGQRVITVYDQKTGKVIRQIPPEELLAVLRQIQYNNALSAGLLFSRRL